MTCTACNDTNVLDFGRLGSIACPVEHQVLADERPARINVIQAALSVALIELLALGVIFAILVTTGVVKFG